jgi:hypothetical protein
MYSAELRLLFISTALYSVILFCVFFWIPFVYFYYEEKDDDDTGKCTVSYVAFVEKDYFLLFKKGYDSISVYFSV